MLSLKGLSDEDTGYLSSLRPAKSMEDIYLPLSGLSSISSHVHGNPSVVGRSLGPPLCLHHVTEVSLKISESWGKQVLFSLIDRIDRSRLSSGTIFGSLDPKK